jgi:hypothetical protein
MSAIPKRFCKRGHDTDVLGRDIRGYCKQCRREWDRRRDPKVRAEREADRTGRGYGRMHPIEWERARVQRWLEIASEEPMTAMQSTQLRGREFGERYARLEAAVPTPKTVNA